MSRIDPELKLDFKDVLIRPNRSDLTSRSQVELSTTLTFPHSMRTLDCVPLVASNMDSIGTFEMAAALSQHKVLTCLHKYYTLDEWKLFADKSPASLSYSSVSTGISNEDLQKLNSILGEIDEISLITVDVANGYQSQFADFVRRLRERYPKHTIIAGNVVTRELVYDLYSAGADVVKVGLGPGSVCTTRLQTGVGYPQFSAVMECSEAAKDFGAKIMSDGGCTCPGDVAKALAAGADLVMLGGMLSGHEQCSGEIKEKADGSLVKTFYGMSSTTAMLKRAGNVPTYRCAEGKTVEVPFRGDVNGTILNILGGLRSTCTYTGSTDISQLPTKAKFIRVSQQSNQIYGGEPK